MSNHKMPSDPPPSGPPAGPLPARDQSNVCQERARLLRGYADAAKTYADRVQEVSELVTSGREQGLSLVRLHCRAAWEETEKSRLALYRHEADHQCDRGSPVRSVCDS